MSRMEWRLRSGAKAAASGGIVLRGRAARAAIKKDDNIGERPAPIGADHGDLKVQLVAMGRVTILRNKHNGTVSAYGGDAGIRTADRAGLELKLPQAQHVGQRGRQRNRVSHRTAADQRSGQRGRHQRQEHHGPQT